MGFQKGNKLGGRPKGAKNLIPHIRERILNLLDKRLSSKTLDDISTEALVRFASSVMPKEQRLTFDRIIEYITTTSRPALTDNIMAMDASEARLLPDAGTDAVNVTHSKQGMLAVAEPDITHSTPTSQASPSVGELDDKSDTTEEKKSDGNGSHI